MAIEDCLKYIVQCYFAVLGSWCLLLSFFVFIGKIEKVKYPAIPCRDITYAVQAMPPEDDVVACIYLGYNATTNSAVHVHVYRCDSPDTAAIFVNNLEMFIQNPEHQERLRKIEVELARKGQIAKRPVSRLDDYLQQKQFQNGAQNGHNSWRSNTSDDGVHFTAGSGSYSSGSDPHSPRSPLDEHVPVFGNRNSQSSTHGDKSLPRQSPRTSSHNEYEGKLQPTPRNSNYANEPQWQVPAKTNPAAFHKEPPQIRINTIEENPKGFDSLADELKARLSSNEEAPILLPPKDYDTIHRKRGNAFDMGNRKCMNKDIVGKFVGLYNASANGNTSDGIVTSQGRRTSNGEHSRNNSDTANQEIVEMSQGPMTPPVDEYGNNPFSPPARPFSPGPLTQEFTQQSYFPSGSQQQLPNYLQRRKSSQSQGSHSRQSSADQSSLDNSMDKRIFSSSDGAAAISQPGGKYSAAKLGLSQKKPLQKHMSSPEFKQVPQIRGGGLYRRQSNDEGYTSMDKGPDYFPEGDHFSPSPPRSGRSSGSNTMRSDAAIDLAASLPAMKLKDVLQKPQGTPVYIDEDDPGAFVPIDYTIAVRGGKERKGLQN